uniref:ORF2 n=1 Tax=Hepelivirus TaxID=1229326 RepID=J7LKW9_9VIRU|nr:ORF2 [Hepelivirus]
MSNLLRLQTAKINTPVLGSITHEGKKIDVECETSSGRAWLAKYLHPPTEEVAGYCGYPDRNTLSTVQLHYRGEKEIPLQCHKGDFKTPNGPANRYLHLFHWGAAAPGIGFWYDQDGNNPNFDPSVQSQILNKQYDPANWDRDLSKVRHCYGSVSIYQDETAFSNRGVITVANFRPDYIELIQPPAATAKEYITTLASKLGCDIKTLKLPREWYKPNMKPMHNEGYEVIYGPREDNLQLNPPEKTKIYIVNTIPKDESDLLNLSRKAYSGMLRDGAFVTSRLTQDVNLYKPAASYNNVNIYVRDINELMLFQAYDSQSSRIPDWADEDFAFTFVMYSQLRSGGDQQQFSANHILFKWYNGFEGDVTTGSSLSTFTGACAMEDMMALRLANNVLHNAPDANVVATNSWATLAKLAMQLAPQAIEWLGNVFSPKKEEKKIEAKVVKQVKKEVRQDLKTPRPKNQQRTNRSRPRRSKSTQPKVQIQTPAKQNRPKSNGPKVPLGEYLKNK